MKTLILTAMLALTRCVWRCCRRSAGIRRRGACPEGKTANGECVNAGLALACVRRPWQLSLTNSTARPQVLDLGPRLFFGFNKSPARIAPAGLRVSILAIAATIFVGVAMLTAPAERHG